VLGDEMKKSTRLKFRSEYAEGHRFDYKDPLALFRFMTEGGKIVPSRISKLSAFQQRNLTKAIKKARSLGLLPLGTDAYDNFDRPEAISAVPFEM
jgi:small subunit ribosomal protein S18